MDCFLQNRTSHVVIDTEVDLLREPIMNIEDISTDAMDLINDDPYEQDYNFVQSGTLICDADDEHDDSALFTGANQFLSPRPIDPSKLRIVNKVPLRYSLLNDNIVTDLIADLAKVTEDDKSENSRAFPLQQQLPISEVLDEDFVFDSVPPPLPLVTPVTSLSSMPPTETNFYGAIGDDNKRKFENKCNDLNPLEAPSKKPKVEDLTNGSFLDMLQAKLDDVRNNYSVATARVSDNDLVNMVDEKTKIINDQASIDFEDESSDPYRFRPYQYEQWQGKFEELCEFKRIHGHCNVPRKQKGTTMLWRWVKRQKYQYKLFREGKQSTLSQERISALENVGVQWDYHGSTWSERLAELTTYCQVNGHCNVPSKYPANPQLSTWVKCQRRQYKLYQSGKPSNITSERIEALAELDFVFEPRAKKTVGTILSMY